MALEGCTGNRGGGYQAKRSLIFVCEGQAAPSHRCFGSRHGYPKPRLTKAILNLWNLVSPQETEEGGWILPMKDSLFYPWPLCSDINISPVFAALRPTADEYFHFINIFYVYIHSYMHTFTLTHI